MDDQQINSQKSVRYEPNDSPPFALNLALGLQNTIITITGIVITPIILINAAGLGDTPYLHWAVFCALAISGLATILQTIRIGQIGSGYILYMGTSGTFISLCIVTLREAGPATLSTLIIASSLIQFALVKKLSLLRRIITPTVAGVVVMLISVTIMPLAFDLMSKTHPEVSASAAPVISLITISVISFIILRISSAKVHLWAMVIGIIIGCIASSFYGLYDMSEVHKASWIGMPQWSAWPGLDLEFEPIFFVLFPAFVLVTIVGAIETMGDAIAIQKVSWKKPRAVDFRAVQGSIGADGVGSLLSGLAGTIPNTTYSSSIAMTEITGVASRKVGATTGFMFIGLAFVPKILALIMAIPAPVSGAYLFVLMCILFTVGVNMTFQDGLNSKNALLVGISYWIGTGFQNKQLFPGQLGKTLESFLENGMASGGFTAITIALLLELTKGRRKKIKTTLDTKTIPKVQEMLQKLAMKKKWNQPSTEQLLLAAEEAIATLIDRTDTKKRNLLVMGEYDNNAIKLEFIAAVGTKNLEDQIALLSENPRQHREQDISLKLLKHVASSVNHQQYHDTDIITISVKPLNTE